jgi:hypothetical protein
VSSKVAEQVTPQVASHADKGRARKPACYPPQEIVGRNQTREKNKCPPVGGGLRERASPEDVNEDLHSVLRRDGTADSGDHRDHNNGVGRLSPEHVMAKKGERMMRVTAQIGHTDATPSSK